jgi:hypothetical protein
MVDSDFLHVTKEFSYQAYETEMKREFLSMIKI